MAFCSPISCAARRVKLISLCSTILHLNSRHFSWAVNGWMWDDRPSAQRLKREIRALRNQSIPSHVSATPVSVSHPIKKPSRKVVPLMITQLKREVTSRSSFDVFSTRSTREKRHKVEAEQKLNSFHVVSRVCFWRRFNGSEPQWRGWESDYEMFSILSWV